MTDLRLVTFRRGHVPRRLRQLARPDRVDRLGGFASFMMIMLGSFQAIEGLVAIFKDDFYHVAPSGLVVNVDYSAWGWTHLIRVLGLPRRRRDPRREPARPHRRRRPGRAQRVLNLVFIEAYPIWSVIIITVDVLVIYALTVHGRELRDSDV